MTTWTETTLPVGAYIYPDYILVGYFVFDWEVPAPTSSIWTPTPTSTGTWS